MEGLFMGRAYQKVLAKKSLAGWGAASGDKAMEGRPGREVAKEKAKQGEFFCGVGEPVRPIYANPTFTS